MPNRDFNHNGRFDIADVIYILNDRLTLKALIENGNKKTANGIDIECHINPFSPSYSFYITVPQGDKKRVLVSVYDMRLHLILCMVDKKLEPGKHAFNLLDYRDKYFNKMKSGVYYLRLQSGSTDIATKFLFLH